MSKLAMIAVGLTGATVLGGVAVILTPIVLPALGGAGLLGAAGTGTAIGSLSGAALTSASTAAVTGTIAGTKLVIGLGAAGLAALGAAVGIVKK